MTGAAFDADLRNHTEAVARSRGSLASPSKPDERPRFQQRYGNSGNCGSLSVITNHGDLLFTYT